MPDPPACATLEQQEATQRLHKAASVNLEVRCLAGWLHQLNTHAATYTAAAAVAGVDDVCADHVRLCCLPCCLALPAVPSPQGQRAAAAAAAGAAARAARGDLVLHV